MAEIYEKVRKAPRARRRLKWIILLLLILLAVVGFSQWRGKIAGWYQAWRQQRSLTQAKALAAQQDFAQAMVALNVAAQANPQNPEAWVVAAEVMESAGSSQAVALRKQIAVNQPTRANRLAWAATAIRFGDLAMAEQALAELPAAERGRSDDLKLQAALATARRRPVEAEEAIRALLKLEPDNAQMKYNLAVIRLRQPAGVEASAARRELEAIAAGVGPLAAEAQRELVRADAAGGRPADALRGMERLVPRPEATLEDWLVLVTLRQQLQPAQAEEAEKVARTRAATQPAAAAQFGRWLLVHNRAEEALAWCEGLPPALRDDAVVTSVRADIIALRKDWPALAKVLGTGAWGKVPAEALGMAMSTCTASERGRTELRRTLWGEALDICAQAGHGQRVLLRLALLWGWAAEAEETLLAIVRRQPGETWALASAVSSAYQRKDTRMLKQAYALWHELQPDNRKATGDWAMIKLLTEADAHTGPVREAVLALVAAEPKNPYYVTTQAFLHYREGRSAEALSRLESLTATELRQPGRAVYHAACLAAEGLWQRAQAAIDLAQKADLLPEERNLLRQASARVQARNRTLSTPTVTTP